jgi:hypothetical protein
MNLKTLSARLLTLLILSSASVFQSCDDEEPKDTTAPEVSITNLAENANVWNTVTIQSTASDNATLSQIDLFVDNNLISSDAEEPFEFTWVSNTVADGTHTVKVVATDKSSNTAEAVVNVSVLNTLVTITVPAQALDTDPKWLTRGFVFLSDSEGKLIASQEYTNGASLTFKSSTFNGEKFYLTEVLNEKIGDGTTATRSRMWTFAGLQRGNKWVLLRDYEDPDDVYVGEATLSFSNVAANFQYMGRTEGDGQFYIEAPATSETLDVTTNPALLYVVKSAIDQGLGTPLPAPTYNLYTNVPLGASTVNLGLATKALTKKTIAFPTDAYYKDVTITGFPVANNFSRRIYSIDARLESDTDYSLYYPSTAFAGYYVESYYETPSMYYWRATTETDFALPTLSADVDFTFASGKLSYKATGADFISTQFFNQNETVYWSLVLPPTPTVTVLPTFELPAALQGFNIPAMAMPTEYGVYDFQEITNYEGLLTFVRNSTYSVDELYDTGKT